MDLKIIYCRGGDATAPIIAKAAGMYYGIEYQYTAYSDEIYMLDGGLDTKWSWFMKKVRRYKPTFALAPDYYKSDKIQLELHILDMRPYVQQIGVCPKFVGAVAEIPEDCVICESVMSKMAGWHIPDDEILPERDYHLLGGDPRLQKSEIRRIQNRGGRVISVDGNKLALKAAYGQVFCNGKWLKNNSSTEENALISAQELVIYLRCQ